MKLKFSNKRSFCGCRKSWFTRPYIGPITILYGDYPCLKLKPFAVVSLINIGLYPVPPCQPRGVPIPPRPPGDPSLHVNPRSFDTENLKVYNPTASVIRTSIKQPVSHPVTMKVRYIRSRTNSLFVVERMRWDACACRRHRSTRSTEVFVHVYGSYLSSPETWTLMTPASWASSCGENLKLICDLIVWVRSHRQSPLY